MSRSAEIFAMHRLLPCILLMVSGLLVAGNLHAADALPAASAATSEYERSEKESKKECERVKNLQRPEADKPSKVMLDSVAGCDAEMLYYDAEHDPKVSQSDWNKVRACAIKNVDESVMLMLYANGYGVKRNYDLAIKYACGREHDSAQVAIIEDLVKLKGALEKPVEPFDLCTYATIPLFQGYCLSRNHEYQQELRNRKLGEIESKLDSGQKTLLARLRQAMLEYSSARTNEETDQGGSDRYVSFPLTAEAVESKFMKEIEELEQGQFPVYTEQQYGTHDKELNQEYRYILHNMIEEEDTPSGFPPISKEGIRTTERAWLKYRDAWVEFGRARYPSVPEYAWKAMLTEWRIADLEDLKNELGMNN